MASTFKLQQLLYADESSFAENAESGTPTWSKNIPFKDATLTLNQDRIPDGSHQPRLHERYPGHPGVRTATLQFKSYFRGHGGTAAGALTTTWLQELIADGLGGGNTSQVGSTLSAGSTAASLISSGATFVAGGIVRVGIKGDGRGDGAAVLISSVSGATATLATDLPGTPNAGDAVYATQVSYVDEGAAAATKRFMVLHNDTNAQWVIFGAELDQIVAAFPIGGMPEVTLTYQAAYWRRVARTFPDSTTLENEDAAPVAGGRFYINDTGTTTHAVITPSEINLTLNTALQPVVGPGGAGTYQHITGWRRTMWNADLEVKIPWDTTYETWWDTANGSLTYKTIVFGANHTDGRAVGFAMPRVFPAGNRPNIVESNEQSYQSVVFHTREGPSNSNDLTRSAIRFFMG